MEQDSSAWRQLRWGIPTASQYSRIITSTGKPSAQQNAYIAELISESVSEHPPAFQGTSWTEHGKVYEPRAKAAYELITGNELKDIGFIFKDSSRMTGASPDALIGDDGVFEVKCPMNKTHIAYLINKKLPTEYVCQVQGEIWCSERDYAIFMSYAADLEPLIIEVLPDARIQDALSEHLPAFLDKLAEARTLIHK